VSVVKLVVDNRNVDFEIKEYRGQRVVTFRDVDVLHKRPVGASRKSFNSHRNQFIEGEDYFVLNTDEAFSLYGVKAPNGLMMFTESGYLLIVKTFTDDLAWQVQRQLVKNYFKAKEMIAQQPQAPQSIEDILISALTSMKDMKRENEELRKDVRHLSLVVDNEVWLTDHQKADIQQAVKNRMSKLKKDSIDAHFQGIYSDLKTFFNVPKYDKIARKDFEQAMELVKGWFPKKKENSPS
jgi:hypothetical protein